MSLISTPFRCSTRAFRLFNSYEQPCQRRRLTTDSSSPSPPYRILLFGADEFSCATLIALHNARQDLIDELVVVTPPDARTGRGLKKIHRPPLREVAELLNLPSIALPSTLLQSWQPPEAFLGPSPSPRSLLLTASFGHLIPSSLLSLFHPLNTLNVHPSLLPKYRGAAPIQWSIVNGDDRTGVTVQELSRGKFDQGRILAQEQADVPSNSDFSTLEPLLARQGGELLVKVLRDLSNAQVKARPQSGQVSQAPKITRDDARVTWSDSSSLRLLRLQRGIGHQFPLWTTLPSFDPSGRDAPPLQLVLLDPQPERTPELGTSCPPGSVRLDPVLRQLVVKCGTLNDVVVVSKIKPSGGKWVEGREWWNGVGRRRAEMTGARGSVVFE